MIAIECHKWRHFGWSMEGCIVPPFCQGQPLDPLCLFVRRKATKIPFQKFIHNFILPIRLRMVRWAVSQLSTQTRKQLCPKITCENWISITYNNLWSSVEILYGLHKCCSHCTFFKRVRKREKMGIFCQSIDHYHDDTLSFWLCVGENSRSY